MASSHWRRSEPELLRPSPPGGNVSNPGNRAYAVPSISISSRGVSAERVSVAALLYLASVGLVGAVTAGLFLGSGVLLLSQPSEQIRAESAILDGSTVDAPRLSGPSANAENNPRVSEGAQPLSSTASEATVIATVQDTAPGEPSRSSISPSVPPLRGQGSDNPRKLSRPLHSRSHPMPGETRDGAAHTQSARQDREHDPEGYAADIANNQEYNQLHATGSAVELTTEASNR